jgi:hypothetical protein
MIERLSFVQEEMKISTNSIPKNKDCLLTIVYVKNKIEK